MLRPAASKFPLTSAPFTAPTAMRAPQTLADRLSRLFATIAEEHGRARTAETRFEELGQQKPGSADQVKRELFR